MIKLTAEESQTVKDEIEKYRKVKSELEMLSKVRPNSGVEKSVAHCELMERILTNALPLGESTEKEEIE